jgi:hypothetical protein
MGLWGNSIELDFTFDPVFWDRCESLLGRSAMFPDSCSSPVLGAPIAVFKILLVIRQLWSGGNVVSMAGLREELAEWEAWVLSLDEIEASISQDAASLMILSASVLVEQLDRGVSKGPPQAAERDAWQLRRIVSILRRRQGDARWHGCYLGNWPVYTVGFFMSSFDDVELVRSELEQRWKLISFSQVERFWKDLELTWSDRGLLLPQEMSS